MTRSQKLSQNRLRTIAGRSICALMVTVLLGSGAGCSKIHKRRLLADADRDFAAKQYDRAEVEYRGALQIPPPNALAIRQLGLIYFEEGRPGEAFRYLSRAAQTEPNNADVQAKLASIYLAAGRPTEARTA